MSYTDAELEAQARVVVASPGGLCGRMTPEYRFEQQRVTVTVRPRRELRS